jgi:autotransporter-associated beta strand protein
MNYLKKFLLSSSVLSTALFSETWNLDSNGNWNVSGNWLPASVPNVIDAVATFGTVITSDRVITLGQNITIGTVNFNHTRTYTVSSPLSGALTFSSVGNALLNVMQGTHSISSTVNLNSDLTVDQTSTGSFTFSGAINSNGGSTLTKNGSGALIFSGTSANTNLAVVVNAGTLILNKTPGVDAIDSATITGGTLLLGAAHQIKDSSTANVVMSGGELDLNGFSDTIHTLDMDAGVVTTHGGALTVGGDSGQLFMKGGSLIQGNLSLSPLAASPAINYKSGVAASAVISGGTLNLDGTTHTISGSASGAPVDLEISSVIISGGLTKNGSHVLKFSGTGANTYTGTTTLNAGTLILNKSAGVIALPGHITLNNSGSSIRCDSPNQIASSSTLTVNTGTAFDLNHNNQTLGLLAGSGSVNLGDATLMLGNSGTSTFQGVLSGTSGGVIKQGSGTINFNGTTANTYAGPTTVNSGTLALGKTSGVQAIAGDVSLISTGTLLLNASEQISTSSTVTMNAPGANFNLNGFAETIGSLIFNAGTLYQNGAPLTLTSTGTALSMHGGTLISGTVNFTGASGGNILFDGTTGSATISGNLDLGSSSRIFHIQSGFNQPEMSISGNITGSPMDKQGPGMLVLSGFNNVQETTISAGRMHINGEHTTADGLTVASGAILGGVGTIIGDVTVNGTLAPGNSIGTITLVGDHVFNPGSILEIELNPSTSDRINVVGSVEIQPSSNLLVIPEAAIYPDEFSYLIVDTTQGASGTFDTVTNTLPTFRSSVLYTPSQIFLTTELLPFATLNFEGNSEEIAEFLDALDPEPGSDLELVIAELRLQDTVEELNDALNAIQPSQFTALALAQEYSGMYVSSVLFDRMQTVQTRCDKICRNEKHFWMAPFGAFSSQHRIKHQPAFKTGTGGFALGVDGPIADCVLLGGAVGYTYTFLDWQGSRGRATIQSPYAGLYTNGRSGNFYAQGALFGSYNHYQASRRIRFDEINLVEINRKAKNTHGGGSLMANVEGGYLWQVNSYLLSPFVHFDYLFLHEGGFKEHGAKSLDLVVKSKNSDLLRSELGLAANRCFSFASNKVSPSFKLSVIRESRFQGKHYTARLNNTDENFRVKGMNPSRTLGGASAGFVFLIPDENCTLSTQWTGEFAPHFYNHLFSLEWITKF